MIGAHAHREAADRAAGPVYACRRHGAWEKRSNSPSSIITRPPPSPSSAGWEDEIGRAVENCGSRRDSARRRAAWWCGRHGRRHACSRAGSRRSRRRSSPRSAARSMSARRPIVSPAAAGAQHADHAGLRRCRYGTSSKPKARSFSATMAAVLVSLNPSSGWA